MNPSTNRCFIDCILCENQQFAFPIVAVCNCDAIHQACVMCNQQEPTGNELQILKIWDRSHRLRPSIRHFYNRHDFLFTSKTY